MATVLRGFAMLTQVELRSLGLRHDDGNERMGADAADAVIDQHEAVGQRPSEDRDLNHPAYTKQRPSAHAMVTCASCGEPTWDAVWARVRC